MCGGQHDARTVAAFLGPGMSAGHSSMKAFVIIKGEVLHIVSHAVYTVLSEYTH